MEEESSVSQASPLSSRKRPRPVLSCVTCRQKKLKCNRETPACQQCVIAGRQSECSYFNQPKAAAPPQGQRSISNQSHGNQARTVHQDAPAKSSYETFRSQSPSGRQSTLHSARGVVEDLQHRVKRLEQHLDVDPRQMKTSLCHGSQQPPAGGPHLDQGSVRMKGGRTRYYSSAHAVSLLNQVPHLSRSSLDNC